MKKIKYVPILKWRAAEITALENVKYEDRAKMMPVIELVMPSVSLYKKDPTTKQQVRKSDSDMYDEIIHKFETKRTAEIPSEIEKAWGNSSVYLDFTLLYGKDTNLLKVAGIKKIVPECTGKGLSVTPILNLSDDKSILDEVFNQLSQKNIVDVCIRITSSDLSNVDVLNKNLKSLISERNIPEEQVHLLIDLKYLSEDMNPSYGLLFKASQAILNIDKWKSFIFASGSFPVDMSKFKVEENPSVLPRADWLSWLSGVAQKDVVRIPIFSDYTIRNPIYNESLQFYTSTATLKYTVGDDWFIFKGERGRNDQYLAHANLLVNSTDKFYGEDYSFGDKYILTKSNHLAVYQLNNSVKGMGKTENWITAGVSHHLALVLSQISNQP